MALSSPGIGSNLDINSIVTQLMSVERAPLTRLARAEASYQTKLSGFGTLKGALSQFQTAVRGLSDASKFQAVKVAAGDPSVATASGSAAASPGTYALKVTQLAQAQKLVAPGVTTATAPVGKGVISIDFGTSGPGSFDSAGGGVKTITIDDSNNSLTGIRDAINKAGIGVTAAIVNDGSGTPFRLALSAEKTGVAASMKISVADAGGDTGLSALLTHDPEKAQLLTETSAAKNAEFTIDGIPVSKASNTVTDVIGGVTLNLLKENPTTATPIKVERDTASITTAVNNFVKAYNEISQNLKDATAYNATTREAAILNGEASVRSIQTQVRNVLTAPVAGGAGTLTRLSEIGVTIQKDGMLAVDSAKLSKAMASNFDDFAALFATAGKSSDTLAAYTSASATTVPGSYALEVTSLATRGSALGSATAAPTTIDATNDTLEVMLNGLTATIKLEQKSYTPAELAAEVQSKFNGNATFSAAGFSVEVSEAGGALSLSSTRFGSASKVDITGGNGKGAVGFDTGTTITAGADVAGTINGQPATGNGHVLTSAGGDSTGLAVTISGGAPGARGTVSYSKGYAHQFDTLTTSLLGSGGLIAARTEGLTSSIKRLGKDQEAMLARLADVEKRYRAQFSALDQVISRMNTTSTYLAQQLAQISSLSRDA